MLKLLKNFCIGTIASVALLTFACPVGLSQIESDGPPPVKAPDTDFYVRLDTKHGPLILKIFYSVVPYTAGNFLALVQKHFYDGLTFHRVEPWVVQGGDPVGNGTGSYVNPATGQAKFIQLETSPRLTHDSPGMVAMARGADINSASCQFYILKEPMSSLNGKYAVFGQVVRGLESVYVIQPGDQILSATILGPDDQQSQPAQQQGPQGAQPPQQQSEPNQPPQQQSQPNQPPFDPQAPSGF